MVLGLIASMFHMNDVFHVLNVFRHWDSSWLSREIIVGLLFAALGFLFAVMQWVKWGNAAIRRIIAGFTAVLGVFYICLMIMIYHRVPTVPTVPAWHTWFTPVQFFLTTILLGSAAVGVAFVGSRLFRQQMESNEKFFGTRFAKFARS